MEKLEGIIGPGTAGLTQKVSSGKEINEEALYVVKPNYLLKCRQNQF
jgi:hypothetical protein